MRIGQGYVRETADGEYEKKAKGFACARENNHMWQKTCVY